MNINSCITIIIGTKVIRRHLDGALPTIRPDLAEYVEFVSGISQLPVMRQAKVAPPDFAPDASYDYVIPATTRALYGIPAGT